ncbi:hypothetical protein ACIHFC_21110 [Streptomyces sp. NPDC052013]|uniref:hypothetical protein n=1 Tax=Streptomyces sp. NPDC052013 TaxID=3365679 RepID=UPI0037D7B31C
MRARTWLRALAAGAAVLAVAGCSKADRAVMLAPGCPKGPAARPVPRSATPGTAYAFGPHFGAPAGSFREGAVPGLTDVVSLVDSGHITVARSDGTVWSYGTDVEGSLGHGSLERVHRAEPRQVTGIGPARAVYSSGPAFFVVLRDGTVAAWGSDRFLVRGGKREGYHGVAVPRPVPRAGVGPGRERVLGDGDTTDHVSARPVRVAGLPPVRRISAFHLTGYAVDTDGGLG